MSEICGKTRDPHDGEWRYSGVFLLGLRGRIKRCVKSEATYLSAEEEGSTSGARVAARGKGTTPHEEGYRRNGYGVHHPDV